MTRRPRSWLVAAWATSLLVGLIVTVAFGDAPESLTDLEEELRQTEIAFARTMAGRDLPAFERFLADETVFFSGDTPLRGKRRVAEVWSRYFEGPDAPFSWEPAVVVVLESGDIGMTSGPVRDGEGNVVARFNSVWKRDSGGRWTIILDRGCDCP